MIDLVKVRRTDGGIYIILYVICDDLGNDPDKIYSDALQVLRKAKKPMFVSDIDFKLATNPPYIFCNDFNDIVSAYNGNVFSVNGYDLRNGWHVIYKGSRSSSVVWGNETVMISGRLKRDDKDKDVIFRRPISIEPGPLPDTYYVHIGVPKSPPPRRPSPVDYVRAFRRNLT